MSDSKPADPGQAIQKAEAPALARSQVSVGHQGVVLSNFAELMAFAKVCADAGVGPKGTTQAQAAVAIQAGLERGMGPLGGLQSAVIINGILSWRGSAVVALIQNSGVLVPGTWRSWVENPGTEQAIGYCRALRKGYAEPFLRSFSVRDAKKAVLWNKGGPWTARPDNMLEWRAIGDMGRFHFYDVLGNLPIAEDVEAGGIGPVGQEAARELPGERQPAPVTLVQDPILAELAAGAKALEPILVEATLVAPEIVTDSSLPATELELRNRDGSVAARIVNLAPPAKTPEVRAQSDPAVERDVEAINQSVEEAFPKAKSIDPGGPCPRCSTKRNELNGCDLCGWPGPDNGERP